MKYEFRPYIVDAVQWTGSDESLKDVRQFLNGEYQIESLSNSEKILMLVKPYELEKRCHVGDWLVRGPGRDIYVTTNQEFRAKFKPVED